MAENICEPRLSVKSVEAGLKKVQALINRCNASPVNGI